MGFTAGRAAAALLLAHFAGLQAVLAQRLREYNLWVCPHCERGVKVADVTDLGCEASPSSAPGGHDWPWVKQALYRFLRSLGPGSGGRDVEEVRLLLQFAGAPLQGECYLGVMALGFFALQFMEPDERYDFMRSTVFGGVTFKRAIPLSYWDVYASGWPIFGLLATAASVMQQDLKSRRLGQEVGQDPFGGVGQTNALAVGRGLTGIELGRRDCCDFVGGEANQHDQSFLLELSGSLGGARPNWVGGGTPLPTKVPLDYLARSAERGCSWGRATAYFAIVEGLLAAEGGSQASLQNATKSLMSLGEHNLDGCEPNITVYHLMQSVWPFWQILGRLELRRLAIEVTPIHPAGPGTEAASGHKPLLPEAVRLKWQNLLRRRGLPSPGSHHQAADGAHRSGPRAAPPASSPCLDVGGGAGLAHVALSADVAQIDGLIVALQSGVVSAGANASRVCFHTFALPHQQDFVVDALSCAFGSSMEMLASHNSSLSEPGLFRLHGSAWLLLHRLNASYVWQSLGVLPAGHEAAVRGSGALMGDDIDEGALKSDTGNLGAVHNFVRFILHELLPDLPRVVYLDVDVVVKGDLNELYNAPLQTQGGEVGTIAAVQRTHQPLRVYVDVLQPAVPTWVPSEAPSFNAGVMVIDLLRWRERSAVKLVAEWIALNARRRLWMHGSQPPLLLLFHDEVVPLDWAWNIDGLGHRLNYPKDVLQRAKLLHWTGPLKPWKHHGVNRMIWEKYTMEYCPAYSFREHTTTCRPDSWFC